MSSKMLKYFHKVVFVSFLTAFLAITHAAQLIDINNADAAAIAENLTGIGASKAQAIVDYRAKNGPFASVDDLVNVKGIGLKTIDRNRDYLTITPSDQNSSQGLGQSTGQNNSDGQGAGSEDIQTPQPATIEQPAIPAS